MRKRKLIVGNWKMNQTLGEIQNFFSELNLPPFMEAEETQTPEVWLAPQALHIKHVLDWVNQKKFPLQIGAQDCSQYTQGAYTGDISAQSLKDIGSTFCLLGHSERRQYFLEKSETLTEKIRRCLENDLKIIFCIGETHQEKLNEQTFDILQKQLITALKPVQSQLNSHNLIVAYEPVWAIGTGLNADSDLAQKNHHHIREYFLKELFPQNYNHIKILYGGSVKPSNIQSYLDCADIDGALVGGASLKGESFSQLVI